MLFCAVYRIHGAFLLCILLVRCGRRVGMCNRNAPLFLHGANMINAAVILNAEKDLYNSVLNRDFSRDIKTDIQKIVEIYVQDEEIKNIMQVYDLTENDFQVIYYHLFASYEFHGLLFVENEYQSAKHLLFVKLPTGQANAPAEQNGDGHPLAISILYTAKNKTPLSLYSNYLILFEKTAGPFFFRKTIQFGKAD